jgi:hypothetical protein
MLEISSIVVCASGEHLNLLLIHLFPPADSLLHRIICSVRHLAFKSAAFLIASSLQLYLIKDLD